MDCLTRQERRVLGIVILLLLVGWVVKTHRAVPAPLPQPEGIASPETRVVPPPEP